MPRMAIDVLQNAGAIRECEEHGWMQDRADPHAWERAIDNRREDPPAGVSPDAAAAEVRDVLNSIGETCPECPPVRGPAPSTMPTYSSMDAKARRARKWRCGGNPRPSHRRGTHEWLGNLMFFGGTNGSQQTDRRQRT